KALSMTTREAASALEVSPSAVVRYESAQRSPSAAQVGAMVDCMVAWDPTSDESRTRRHAHALALLFRDPDYANVMLVNFELTESHLRKDLEDGLERTLDNAADGLTNTQVRVLTALVAHPATLDRLVELVKNDPLQPFKEALGGATSETRR